MTDYDVTIEAVGTSTIVKVHARDPVAAVRTAISSIERDWPADRRAEVVEFRVALATRREPT